MREGCAACGLTFEREPGYFVGAIYLNYGVTVAVAAGVYVALGFWTALGLNARVAVLAGVTVVFPLWFFRHSKGLWLALDHLVDPGEPGPLG